MWQQLIRFLFPERSAAANPPLVPPPRTRRSVEEHDNQPPPELNAEEAFFRCVLGVDAFMETPLNPVEKLIKQQLGELLSMAVFDEQVVPRLSTVIPQILNALKNDEVSGKGLAEQVGRDPVLVGEVIRIANSAYYQTTQKINSLERAIVMIGRIGLQRLVANVLMRPIFNVQSGRVGQRAGQYLWSQSERCALACSYLSRGLYEPFDGYLSGMACKTGMIVAVRFMDQLGVKKDLQHSMLFYNTLLQQTKQLSVRIAESWDFPDGVLEALAEQAKRQPSGANLGNVLMMADCISQLHVLVEAKRLPDDINLLNQRLGDTLSERQIRCYKELPKLLETNPN